MSSITLNTLKIAANKESSTNGFYMNAEAGWHSYDADEYEMSARVSAPGSFSSEQAFASKATPSFEGVYSGTSGLDAAQMKAYFKSIIRQGMNIPVTYDDAGFTTFRECKVARVTIPHNGGRPGFKWAVDLIATDPYMYGPETPQTTGLPVTGGGLDFGPGNSDAVTSTYQAVQSGDMTEKVVMTVGTAPGSTNTVSVNLQTSMLQASVVKSAVARLRDGVNGTVLASRTIPDTGDSGTGTTDTWTYTGSVTPTASQLVVTVQVTGNAAGLFVGPSTFSISSGLAFPVDFGAPSANGRLTIVNNGYAPTYSKFEVQGGFDASGFSIIRVKTGERITLSRAVPASSTVYLNSRTGRVSIDGYDNDISGFLTQYDWWQTDPMTSEEVQFIANGSPSGTPLLTARTRPAYY